MIELYSYKGQYPFPLPSDMTGYDINDFVLAPEKPIVPYDKKISWDGSNWILLDRSENERIGQWAIVRSIRNDKLSKSDVQIIRAFEDGTEIPQEWREYRQALRDITNQENPWYIEWPAEPVKIKDQI